MRLLHPRPGWFGAPRSGNQGPPWPGETCPPLRSSRTASTFEVERFEWVDGDRLEVTGRWYGLRGHRFVRPVLVVQAADDEQRRLLALLDHKPWAAEDGDEWIAAFPWEGEPLELTAAELAVAPSLAVDLPVPRVPGQRGAAPAGSEGPLHARRGPRAEPEPAPAPRRAPGRTKPRRRRRHPRAPRRRGVTPEEVAALRAQLASEQASVRRLAAAARGGPPGARRRPRRGR